MKAASQAEAAAARAAVEAARTAAEAERRAAEAGAAEFKRAKQADHAYREGELRKVYAQLDVNNNGTVNEDELLMIGMRRQLYNGQDAWTLEQNATLMDAIGTDVDGNLPEENFVSFFNRSFESNREQFNKRIGQFSACALELARMKTNSTSNPPARASPSGYSSQLPAIVDNCRAQLEQEVTIPPVPLLQYVPPGLQPSTEPCYEPAVNWIDSNELMMNIALKEAAALATAIYKADIQVTAQAAELTQALQLVEAAAERKTLCVAAAEAATLVRVESSQCVSIAAAEAEIRMSAAEDAGAIAAADNEILQAALDKENTATQAWESAQSAVVDAEREATQRFLAAPLAGQSKADAERKRMQGKRQWRTDVLNPLTKIVAAAQTRKLAAAKETEPLKEPALKSAKNAADLASLAERAAQLVSEEQQAERAAAEEVNRRNQEIKSVTYLCTSWCC